MSAPSEPDSERPQPDRRTGFLLGVRAAWGVPGLVLFASMVGYGGLVRASGIDLPVGLASTVVIWALPSQVVLAGAIAGGTSIVAAALAVSLSAVRLLPMTAALLPSLKGEGTPRWALLALVHFIAVTPWTMGHGTLPTLPRRIRPAWFAGVGLALSASNLIATAVGYWSAATLPPAFAGALVFLTPLYFLLSMSGTARTPTDRLAIAFGLVATPLVGLLGGGAALLWGGLVGGTAAFAVGRLIRRRW